MRTGTGGKSIYGTKFADENFKIKHTRKGQLSIDTYPSGGRSFANVRCRHGERRQGYQWVPVLHHYCYHLVCDLISDTAVTNSYSWLDGRHVVFGEVLEGYDVVEKVEDVPKGPGDKPKETIKIVKSGELELEAKGSDREL